MSGSAARLLLPTSLYLSNVFFVVVLVVAAFFSASLIFAIKVIFFPLPRLLRGHCATANCVLYFCTTTQAERDL